MEMSGEERIPASQADTWAALNDPEMLKACVPGCESIERVGDDEFQVLMVARGGPVEVRAQAIVQREAVGPVPGSEQ
jgi:carbon monoxide dehydrogenase subunit G